MQVKIYYIVHLNTATEVSFEIQRKLYSIHYEQKSWFLYKIL